jgi:hypothetical protein
MKAEKRTFIEAKFAKLALVYMCQQLNNFLHSAV